MRVLPPDLSLQYQFIPSKFFSPYLGAGLNYTITYEKNSGRNVNSVDFSNEFGWALKVKFDCQILDKWLFNLDVKKVFVETEIKVNGKDINANNANLDPCVFGVGFGYKF